MGEKLDQRALAAEHMQRYVDLVRSINDGLSVEAANNPNEEKDRRIAELEAEVTSLRELASKDPLTGLLNRRGWGEQVGLMLDLQKEAETSAQVYTVIIDFDDFKKVNDRYGHDIGDQALKHVAEIITKNVRDYDVVGRYGGDEFIVALTGADARNAEDKADKLRTAVESSPMVIEDGREIVITLSIGVGTVMEDFEADSSISLKDAGDALHSAKVAGKNRVSTNPRAA